ncbi:ABC transporter permease [Amycolatopsis sp. NPDC051061]|uniref:ABC transporter permease n=1 Tax=Amycolatopsis sp. NPDC051061 TaxID=3155042 RepID=UPI00341B54F7
MTRPAVRLGPGDVVLLGLLGPRTRPLRAALSSLGISIGIATMIVVIGISTSGQRALDDRLSLLGTNLLRAEARVDQGTQTLPPVPAVAAEMTARIPPVQLVSQVANTHAQVRRSAAIPASEGSGLTVLAAANDLLPVLGAHVASGVFLNPANAAFPTVVLGAVAATRLGITSLDPAGRQPEVWIGERAFTVMGVLAPSPLAPEIERSVLVGWPAAIQYLEFDSHPTVLYVRVDEAQITAVRGVLAQTMFPADPGRIIVSRPSDALAAKQISETTFSGLLLGLAAVALLVGAVGVANTMIISVLERTREIGLRRALGATRRHIRGQFLTESVALCLFGGLTGVAVGLLATVDYAVWRGWPPTIPLSGVADGVASALVVGVLAGLHPALRASKLSPTDALAT